MGALAGLDAKSGRQVLRHGNPSLLADSIINGRHVTVQSATASRWRNATKEGSHRNGRASAEGSGIAGDATVGPFGQSTAADLVL
jgi:hypothetical protein